MIKYICREMLEGLDFIHKHRVIHRDLKAGNVIITMAGKVKLGKTLSSTCISVVRDWTLYTNTGSYTEIYY